MKRARIAVLGGGWAGISAAITLADLGHAPELIEASRQLGGRARRVDWAQPGASVLPLDNGQHILIGAYRSTLELMRRVGVEPDAVLKRAPLALANSAGFHFAAPALRAPWHLLAALAGARGLSFASRWSMTRLLLAARFSGWRVPSDRPLLDWLRASRQPSELIELLWSPLCVAALNTPVALASTQVFLNVLRDSLGGAARDSDLLLPCRPLDQLLPEAAQRVFLQRGVPLRLGLRANGLSLEAAGVCVATADGAATCFDGAVIATPAHQVSTLLAHASLAALADTAQQCAHFRWQPISTVYLRYARHQRLAEPMMALQENPAQAEFGQWVFDKEVLGGHAGLYAVVISAEGPHGELDQAALVAAVERQLARQPGLDAHALEARVITEKRATFACLPNLVRPTNRTAIAQIVLAGDYTASDYPATLESAVVSGESAARTLASSLV